MSDTGNQVWLSVASVWELVIKIQTGKLRLRSSSSEILEVQKYHGVIILPISLDHAMADDRLPLIHKDPFDRLLMAQTMVEDADLVWGDLVFRQYPVRLL